MPPTRRCAMVNVGVRSKFPTLATKKQNLVVDSHTTNEAYDDATVIMAAKSGLFGEQSCEVQNAGVA